MPPWTLVLLNSLEVVLAAAFLVVAGRYQKRGSTGFALFWGAFGLYALTESCWSLAMSTLELPLAVGVTALQVKILLASVGFYGLATYLLKLYTGRDLRLVVGTYYAIAGVLILYDYMRMAPMGQAVMPWRGALLYAHTGTPVGILLPIAEILPAFAAAIAFLMLARVTVDPAARRRILRLGAALAIFLGGLALGAPFAGWFWYPLVEKGLALVAVAGALPTVLRAPS